MSSPVSGGGPGTAVLQPERVRRAALVLGVVYLLLGAMETVRLLVTGTGGFAFWFGTLVGGGALVLAGALPRRVPPDGRHVAAVVVGAGVGLPACAWTVVVPLYAAVVMVLTAVSGTGRAPSAS